MKNIETFARKMIKSGLDFTTFNIDFNKPEKERKSVSSKWMDKQADYDICRNFSRDNGIALKTGGANGGLILIDFDNHRGDVETVYKRFVTHKDVVPILENNNLYIEKTQSGGFHILFKCDDVQGCQKLAMGIMKGADKGTTLIETREEGGLCFIAPSPGYEQISGDLFNIPKISVEEKDTIYFVSRLANEVFNDETAVFYESLQDGRPGDLLHSDPELAKRLMTESLEGRGWSTKDGYHWTRPGKNKGVSGVMNRAGVQIKTSTFNMPTFKNFSSNAGLQEKLYTPFYLIADLEFGGDLSATSRWLLEAGYVKTAEFKKVNDELELKEDIISSIKDGDGLKILKRKALDYEENYSIPADSIQEIIQRVHDQNKDLFGFNKKPAWKQAREAIKNMYFVYRDDVSDVTKMVAKGDKERKLENIHFFKNRKSEDLNRDTVHGSLLTKYNITCPLTNIDSYLNDSNFISHYDPFNDYFSNLKMSYGLEKTKEFLSHVPLEDEKDRAFFEMMFIKHLGRMYKCATNDNYVNRYVFTLIGEERCGKSKLFHHLNPFKNDYYSATHFDPKNKDHLHRLTSCLILSVDEIDKLKEDQQAEFKNFVSMDSHNERMAFKKNAKTYIRRGTIFANGNKDDFLHDGENTRFLVFKTKGKYDWRKYRTIPLDEIYSEIVSFVRRGGDVELAEEEERMQSSENEKYRNLSGVDELMYSFFKKDKDCTMRSSEVIRELSRCMSKMEFVANRINENSVGRSLKKLFEKTRKKDGSHYHISPRKQNEQL